MAIFTKQDSHKCVIFQQRCRHWCLHQHRQLFFNHLANRTHTHLASQLSIGQCNSSGIGFKIEPDTFQHYISLKLQEHWHEAGVCKCSHTVQYLGRDVYVSKHKKFHSFSLVMFVCTSLAFFKSFPILE